MADDIINALQQSNRSASVLQGIANPPQVNPLAAVQAGNQAAQAEFQTRGMQAQQAIGQILQQSTDENGNVDYDNAHRLAAKAGPLVQMGMMKFAQDASGLRGRQIEQAGALHSFVGNLAASLMNDPSDDNLARVRAAAVANRLPPAGLAEIDRIASLPPDQRRQEAYKHTLARIDALGQMTRGGYGTPEMTDTGTGGRRPVLNTPPTPYSPGGATVLPGGVTVGPSPGDRTTTVVPDSDELGPIPLDANNTPTRPTKGNVTWKEIRVPATAVPGTPQGGQQITPPGAPPVSTGTIPGTGRPPAGSKLLNPNRPQSTEPATPPPAETTPPVPTTATPTVPPIPAPASPSETIPLPPGASPPPVRTSAPQGQPAALEDNQKTYRADMSAIPDVMQRARNTAKAYEALSLLKDLNSTTGVGASAINTARSRLTTLGLSNAQSMKVQQLQEEFGKYTKSLMLDAAGGGSTNLGKEIAEQSNPGDHLSMAANFDVLRKNMGETLQKIAAAKSHENAAGDGYISHRGDVSTGTDPRGFVWDMYDNAEKAKIMADAKRDGQAAVDKLNAARGMSHSLGLRIPGATTPPPPDKRSMLMPPGAPQNALMMAG